jgi:hypothetical protein
MAVLANSLNKRRTSDFDIRSSAAIRENSSSVVIEDLADTRDPPFKPPHGDDGKIWGPERD